MLYMAIVTTNRGSFPVKRRMFIESDDYATAYALAKPHCGPNHLPKVYGYVPPVPDVTMTKAEFQARRGQEAYGRAARETRYHRPEKYRLSQTGEL